MKWRAPKIEILDYSFQKNIDLIYEIKQISFSNLSGFNKRVNFIFLAHVSSLKITVVNKNDF